MKLFDVIAVGSSEDGQRFITLGADPDKVICTGSTKFERRPNLAAKAQAADFGQKLSHRGRSVFLAASTHPGEEEIVIAAYKKLLATSPALQLWLAPRHPERATIVGQLVREAGLDYQLWHRIKENEVDYGPGVLVIDTVGDLFALYCLADLIFVGGSLVPHGGQNLLEPASWGKMPLYGPFLDNFRAAHGLLHRAEAGMEIRDVASLVKTGEYCLTHPEEMQRRGQRGLMALQSHQGAAKRQAELLLKLLDKQERREKNLE